MTTKVSTLRHRQTPPLLPARFSPSVVLAVQFIHALLDDAPPDLDLLAER